MSRERAEMRRPAVKMATAMPAAEMVTTTAATMSTAVMTAAVATAMATAVTAPMPSTMAAATSRDGEVRHGQHRCEDNRGNSHCDL